MTQLQPDDRVAIVTYAGHAGTALEPTAASDKAKILGAIERLEAGGSTAGGEGIRQAYALAEQNFDPTGVNRVILATDGDFNVGITSRDELKGFVERQRGKGIFLSVLGFGMGNYNDAMMQALAQNGNGAAAYIDTINEARKVLVEEATSTLIPIAKDVKIQVEFNPATVAEYRLIGYETRLLNRDDFANDKVDAGDVGSGQTVTALYEIVPVGGPRAVGDLRYAPPAPRGHSRRCAGGVRASSRSATSCPKSDTSTLITTPVDRAAEHARFDDAPVDARFAAGVAAFGEILRGGRHTGTFGYDDVLRIASAARGDDPFGYRAEFLQLVRAAKTASAHAAAAAVTDAAPRADRSRPPSKQAEHDLASAKPPNMRVSCARTITERENDGKEAHGARDRHGHRHPRRAIRPRPPAGRCAMRSGTTRCRSRPRSASRWMP